MALVRGVSTDASRDMLPDEIAYEDEANTFDGLVTANVGLALNGEAAAGGVRDLSFKTDGVARWLIRTDTGAETGSDAGSPLEIVARADNGDLIDVTLTIVRAAGGLATLARPLQVGGASHYLSVAADGELTLVGTARVKKEIYIPVSRQTLGAGAPTATTRAVGASGSVKVPVLSFSKTVAQETYFEIHIPTDCDGTVNVEFHLMWFPGASWTTGNYLWTLDYLVKDDSGGDLSAGTPTPLQETATPNNATDIIETVFQTTIDAGPEQVIWCRLYRDIADNADDTGHVRFCEIEYTVD